MGSMGCFQKLPGASQYHKVATDSPQAALPSNPCYPCYPCRFSDPDQDPPDCASPGLRELLADFAAADDHVFVLSQKVTQRKTVQFAAPVAGNRLQGGGETGPYELVRLRVGTLGLGDQLGAGPVGLAVWPCI